MIVRWGLADLPAVLEEAGIERPLLVASSRWNGLVDLPLAGRWTEVPSDRIKVGADADGLLAIGGGSAIDTAKFASTASGLAGVSVPTTYSGSEWTPSYGIRRPDRRMVGGGGGAHLAGIVYDVELTIELPREETVGTALNALAHCAEALYLERSPESDRLASEGATLIAMALPGVVDAPGDRALREELLRGAAAAGEALVLAGLGLAHALAQALGGAFGVPHGAMNALSLPPALRFNMEVVPDQIAMFGRAIGAESDPAARVEELARLGGFSRLRDFAIPETALGEVAVSAAGRIGNRRNPRPATVEEIAGMLRSIW